jgi:hypothetical protein
MRCPPDEALIALGDGELAESHAQAVRAHVAECTRCRAELAKLAELGGDLRARVPGALGMDVEAFADVVLAQIDRPRAEPREARWRRWGVILAAAAALPLAATAAYRWSHAPNQDGEWTARGSASVPAELKRTLVRFGRVTATSFEPLVDGATLQGDALLAVEVGATDGSPRFLLAFLVDSAGERHWIYPVYEPGAPPPSSVAMPVTTTPRVLGSMVRLDRPAVGAGRLVAIVLPRSETVEHVEGASLDDLSRERLAKHYAGSLVVVTTVEVR